MLKENIQKEVAYIDERKKLLSHIELGRIDDKIRQEKKKAKMSSDDENSFRDSLIITESINVEHLNQSIDESYIWGTFKTESKEFLLRELVRMDEKVSNLKTQRNYIVFLAVIAILYFALSPIN